MLSYFKRSRHGKHGKIAAIIEIVSLFNKVAYIIFKLSLNEALIYFAFLLLTTTYCKKDVHIMCYILYLCTFETNFK